MKAMILAAGLGTRLRPFTLARPKPLFPVVNHPLLLLTVSRLRKAGFGPIIVNCHHLAGQMQAALQQEQAIILQQEAEILGTGGGLRKALAQFGQEPVLVVNGDIYHTLDFRELYLRHCASGQAITMVLHDCPRFNKVAMDAAGHILGFGGKWAAAPPPAGVRLLAFTGIHIIRPDVLKLIPVATFYSILDCYRTWLGEGGTIRAEIAVGHTWHDIGTIADYLEIHAGLLTGLIAPYEELGLAAGAGPFHVAADARLGKNVRMQDWVCIGRDVMIGDHARLERTVVWDGARIAAGAEHRDTIVM